MTSSLMFRVWARATSSGARASSTPLQGRAGMQGVKTRMVWGNAVGECYGGMLWGNVVGKCVQSIGEGWGVGARHQQRGSLRGLCSCNQKGGLGLPPCAHGNMLCVCVCVRNMRSRQHALTATCCVCVCAPCAHGNICRWVCGCACRRMCVVCARQCARHEGTRVGQRMHTKNTGWPVCAESARPQHVRCTCSSLDGVDAAGAARPQAAAQVNSGLIAHPHTHMQPHHARSHLW